ncbi:MAG TPA: hypothetical protein VI434_09160 [Candidatus Dormibacteraeota bacterium]
MDSVNVGVGVAVGAVVGDGVGDVVATALGNTTVEAQPASATVAIVATIPTLPRCAMTGDPPMLGRAAHATGGFGTPRVVAGLLRGRYDIAAGLA